MLNTNKIVLRIEEVRSNHQLSAAGFASKIGVQRSAMSHILSGRNKPSLEFLMKIYEAFDEVGLDWLLLGTISTPTPKQDQNSSPSFVTAEAPPSISQKTVSISKTTEIQNPFSNQSEESESPKEIIYLYNDGSFERFVPKK
jgi:transcriptional regulator with XRE-family HTH domain